MSNVTIIMCPAGDEPAAAGTSVICVQPGTSTPTGSIPYLGQPTIFGGTGDPSQSFMDGMELGWAVAGVMVIVYVIKRIYR